MKDIPKKDSPKEKAKDAPLAQGPISEMPISASMEDPKMQACSLSLALGLAVEQALSLEAIEQPCLAVEQVPSLGTIEQLRPG